MSFANHTKSTQAATLTLLAVAIAFTLYYAISRAWVSDDAFISFRYAKNFVAGHGLIFNLEEPQPVEGYTNFLWTILVALGMALGLDPVPWAQGLGIACHIGTVLVLAWQARTPVGWSLPIAALAYAFHQHANLFATGCLETALFTLLVTAGLCTTVRAERARNFMVAGTLLILATMTRPDGAIVYAVCAALTLGIAIRARRPAFMVAFALPFLVLYLPYFAWKWQDYGYPFPNTFYAKSASAAYVTQGLAYLAYYFQHYVLATAGILILPVLAFVRRRSRIEVSGWSGFRGPLLLTVTIGSYLTYIAWVGGDFMYGRFCIPMTPALLLWLQMLLSHLELRSRLALVIGVGAASLFPYTTPPQTHGYTQHKIAEEHRIYFPWLQRAVREVASQVATHLRGLDTRVAVKGAQMMFCYYADFATIVEMNGLTDAHISHRRITKRGRPGHEKVLSYEDPYLRERRVHFVFHPLPLSDLELTNDRIGKASRNLRLLIRYPVPTGDNEWWLTLTILTWDRELMDALGEREHVVFQPFERTLDRYLETAASKPLDEVRADYAAFREFYFDHNRDPERVSAFQRLLQK